AASNEAMYDEQAVPLEKALVVWCLKDARCNSGYQVLRLLVDDGDWRFFLWIC
ncbi:hypothetical protein DXG01_001921, partial [Tephrocybe rancida]